MLMMTTTMTIQMGSLTSVVLKSALRSCRQHMYIVQPEISKVILCLTLIFKINH